MKVDIADVMALAGLGSITGGAYLLDPAWALIVFGAGLYVIGLVAGIGRARKG